MAFQAQVTYKRIIKGSTTQEGIRKDYVNVSSKSNSLAKGQIKAKYPNDKIVFMDIKWR